MIRERSYCLDLDKSGRSRWSDSKTVTAARRSPHNEWVAA
jgi:hypothetical protein